MQAAVGKADRKSTAVRLRILFQKNWGLYVLAAPTLIFTAVFLYGPMFGIIIAFEDFSPSKGFIGSPFVGFKYFLEFFNSYNFWSIFINTLTLSLYNIVANFPIPILFALLLNQVVSRRFKSLVQTVSYAPYFISVVVLVGMLSVFLSPQTGIVNIFIKLAGGQPVYFMGKAEYFKHIYVWSGVWQTTGQAAIIYIAALTSISQELHQAAMVDGATKLQRLIHIDVPGIMPTVITMMLLNLGRTMSIGFEKAYLMQNTLNISASQIISTYVYTVGLQNAEFSYATAIGLFNAVINFTLVVLVNYISRKSTDISLW